MGTASVGRKTLSSLMSLVDFGFKCVNVTRGQTATEIKKDCNCMLHRYLALPADRYMQYQHACVLGPITHREVVATVHPGVTDYPDHSG